MGEKRFGLNIDGRLITNLRFANDVLLLASSRGQLHVMIKDLAAASKAVGLSLHLGKAKVLTNMRTDLPYRLTDNS